MKQLVLFSLFIVCFYPTSAQDVAYLDKSQKITTKENAEFIRVTTTDDEGYKVEVSSLSTGKTYSVLNYKDKALTILDGPAKYFYTDGMPDSEGSYSNNKRDGTWSFYFPSGKPSGKVFFSNGKVATSEYIERFGHMMDEGDHTFPSFKGGKEALILYIRKTFKPLQSSADGKERIKGTMKVGFVVSETGKVTNVHIVSGINEEVNEKAIKLISSMPDWYPGRQSDTPIKVPLIIPIIF